MERLYKARDDKVFDGVCGGIGQYLNIDPVIIRLLWLVLVVFGGTGVLAYLVAMIIIPKAPVGEVSQESSDSVSHQFWGILLIVAGLLLLMGFVGPVGGLFAGAAVIMRSILWPVIVIALGLYLFLNQTGKQDPKSSLDEVFPSGKKLYRSRTDSRFAGVCGGIGQYFGIDSNIIRIFWVMATLGSFGFGVLAYILLALILNEAD